MSRFYDVLLLGQASPLKALYFNKLSDSDSVDIHEVDFHQVLLNEENTGVPLEHGIRIRLINVPHLVENTEVLSYLYQQADYFILFHEQADPLSLDILNKEMMPTLTACVTLNEYNHQFSCVANEYDHESRQLRGRSVPRQDATAPGVTRLNIDLSMDDKDLRQPIVEALEKLIAKNIREEKDALMEQAEEKILSRSQYHKYWEVEKSVKENVIAILRNYVSGTYGAATFFHRGRHHTQIVSQLVEQLENDEVTLIEGFNTLADLPKNPTGSLSERLEFLRGKLIIEEGCDPASLHESIFEAHDISEDENRPKGWLGGLF